MECPFQARGKKDLLLDYCSHSLDAKAAEEVETHLAACPQCKAWTDAHMRTWSLLDDWQAAPVSPDFERRLRERIALLDEQPAPWWRAGWRSLGTRALKPALAAAVVVVLLLAALLFVRPSRTPAQPTMDADHLEKALDDVDLLRQVNAPSGTAAQEAM